ncbi:MAG: sigma-70 family RNA polymerase sigma factor [Rhodobacterales bacterium]|nr:sigma-70 family RNA polymerase sigma factor [Rhodobacterales bacterium]
MRTDFRDDVALLDAWKCGDEQAFTELVHRHGRGLKGYALRILGNSEHAEDVYAETFVRVARSNVQWTDRGTVRGWLFTIAHRLCLDELRRRKTRQAAYPHLVHLQIQRAWTPGPEAKVEAGRRVVQLEEALRLLPETHREVVLLRAVHGLSAKEAADVLECTPSQVDSRLAYARKQLRVWLEKPGVNIAGGRGGA